MLGCSKDDESSTANSEVEGTWKTPCHLTSGGSYYHTHTVSVAGTNVVEEINYFSDSGCSSDNYTTKESYSSYSAGQDMVFSSYGSSGGSGKQYTMTFNSVTETPQNSAEVNWYNNNSYCGDSDWALDTEKDTTGKTCGGSERASANTTIYGLYLLDGNKLFTRISSSSYPNSVYTGDNDTLTKQ